MHMTTTLRRLGVLAIMEPEPFNLTPEVPAIYLPWVLHDHGYALRKATAFVGDVLVFCLVAPFVEEMVKVRLVCVQNTCTWSILLKFMYTALDTTRSIYFSTLYMNPRSAQGDGMYRRCSCFLPRGALRGEKIKVRSCAALLHTLEYTFMHILEVLLYKSAEVPAIYLPWVLHDHSYSLRKATAFVGDVLVFCLVAPFVEEMVKVRLSAAVCTASDTSGRQYTSTLIMKYCVVCASIHIL